MFNLSSITPKTLPLSQYEYKLSHPYGLVEEGLFEHVLNIVNPVNHFVIEIGAGDGTNYSASRNLIERHGYKALLVEPDVSRAAQLFAKYEGSSKVQTMRSRITRGGMVAILNEASAPRNPALLALDCGGTDYHIWEALIHEFRAEVVAIKFNGSFGPSQEFVVDYQDDFAWKGDDYFGASFATLVAFGEKNGYRLIHCTSVGDNLVFVRKEHAGHFPSCWMRPEDLYQVPQYGKNGRAPNGKGHPASTQNTTAWERFWCKTRYALMTVPRKIVYANHDPKGHTK